MAQNPFEAPRIDAQLAPAPVAARFEVGRAMADAWHAVIGDLATVIIASAIFIPSVMASILTVLGAFLFLPVLVYGGVKTLLNLHDGIAGYTDLGDGFPRYWSALGDALVMMFFQSMIYLPCWILIAVGSMVDGPALSAACYVAGLATAAVLAPRFVFAPFYLVDHGAPPAEAMRLSWSVTADQKLPALSLVIASTIVGAAGAACGIGAMISIPIAWVMFASAFRQMHPRPKRVP